MKLFSFRMRAMSVFIRDNGMSTRRCLDWHALRMRVNMSAIGSVMLIANSFSPRILADVEELLCECARLPARLAHAGDHPRQCQLPEADPAEAEASQIRARTPAPVAAVLVAHLELRLQLCLFEQ